MPISLRARIRFFDEWILFEPFPPRLPAHIPSARKNKRYHKPETSEQKGSEILARETVWTAIRDDFQCKFRIFSLHQTHAHTHAHNPPLPHGTMVAEVHFSPNSKKENLHNICYDFIFFPWWPFSPPPVPRLFLTLSRSKCLFEPFYSHTLTHVWVFSEGVAFDTSLELVGSCESDSRRNVSCLRPVNLVLRRGKWFFICFSLRYRSPGHGREMDYFTPPLSRPWKPKKKRRFGERDRKEWRNNLTCHPVPTTVRVLASAQVVKRKRSNIIINVWIEHG